jgi:hypothetical protein
VARGQKQIEETVAQKTAGRLLNELTEQTPPYAYDSKDIAELPATKQILNADERTQKAIAREAIDRIAAMRERLGKPRGQDYRYMNLHHEKGLPLGALQILCRLLRRQLPFTGEDYACMVDRTAHLEMISIWCLPYLPLLISHVEKYVKRGGLPKPIALALERFLKALDWDSTAAGQKLRSRVTSLLEGPPTSPLQPGEAWSDVALTDFKKLKSGSAKAWNALLLHCQTGGKGKFTERWQKQAHPLIDAVGFDTLKEHLLRWFPLVDKPRTMPKERQSPWEPDYDNLIISPHVELLRGLVWCAGLKEDAELARAIARLALSAYRKIPGKGPRLVSLGNACVTALGMMPDLPAIGQLAILKVKVKFGTAQKEIEKAFNASAVREGLPRDEIEELAVPAYGLEEVGIRRETFGDYQAELIVDGSSAVFHWLKEGKPLKSVPAAVKKDHAEEFKELQAAVKDVNAMLPAQRERLDTLYRIQKSWPLAVWKERYLDHPLIGTLSRRLIWTFTSGKRKVDGIYHNGSLVDIDDGPLHNLEDKTTVALWHPLHHSTDAVLAWRAWLEKHEVRQPFKQAHREIYVLTDAERNTRAYSNRYAAHILKQHQFNALCAARGWKNKLRLMVDDEFPPASVELPAWNLRAEFWIEGAGDDYGTDTNETGTFLYLTTDQVRFYALGTTQRTAHASGGGYHQHYRDAAEDEPLALDTIPPLVFSEVMRDVDLFVGVASVGNDPNWLDGGPDVRYREYWHSYSFGDLSATAQTRKVILERLIPRLKIADRCSFADRWLVVRGHLRTYKVHLGSGNVLMSPNDQYLCIVPKRAPDAGSERVFLPFEGDTMLSVILSKALLLADDKNIRDASIARQIRP